MLRPRDLLQPRISTPLRAVSPLPTLTYPVAFGENKCAQMCTLPPPKRYRILTSVNDPAAVEKPNDVSSFIRPPLPFLARSHQSPAQMLSVMNADAYRGLLYKTVEIWADRVVYSSRVVLHGRLWLRRSSLCLSFVVYRYRGGASPTFVIKRHNICRPRWEQTLKTGISLEGDLSIRA